MGLSVYALGKMNVQARTKLFVLLVIAIAIIFVMRRTDISGKVDQALFAPKDIDHNCVTARITDDRKKFLKDIAGRIYTDIYDTPGTGHDCDLYTEANALCDEELEYVAVYYKQYLSNGVSIYNEWSGWNGEYTLLCDIDAFKAHLARIGQRS